PPNPTASLDPALEEAVRSLIYAAPRTEVKELHAARALLIEKFGKEVALGCMEGEGVAERVLSKLRVETPRRELVDAYLAEIAKFYGVPFGVEEGEEEGDDAAGDEDGEGGGGGGGVGELAEQKAMEPALEAEPAAKARMPASGKVRAKAKAKAALEEEEEEEPRDGEGDVEADEVAELSKATPPRKLGGPQSPLRITPPSPSTDNVAPKLRLPGASAPANAASGAKVRKGEFRAAGASGAAGSTAGGGPGGKIPDVDELARRFAELKR
ncbi:hypothetical protein AOQ84DRAFT_363227, partial [Glonium stellatum]